MSAPYDNEVSNGWDKYNKSPGGDGNATGNSQSDKANNDKNTEFIERYFTELGVTQSSMLNAMSTGLIDSWIEEYWKQRRLLRRRERGYLHWRINSFYYMMMEERYLPLIELFTQKMHLARRYRISRKDASEVKRIWLMIAGAYVVGRKYIREKQIVKEKTDKFFIEIPDGWKKSTKTWNRQKATPYEKFIIDLYDNWSAFIKSYECQLHGAYGTNIPSPLNQNIVTGCLEMFINGVTKNGHVIKGYGLSGYPKPLSYYAIQKDARYLYRARDVENNILRTLCVHPTDKSKCLEIIPFWLMLGRDDIKFRNHKTFKYVCC